MHTYFQKKLGVAVVYCPSVTALSCPTAPTHPVILPKGQIAKPSDRFEPQDTRHLVKNFLTSGGVIKIPSPAQTGTKRLGDSRSCKC